MCILEVILKILILSCEFPPKHIQEEKIYIALQIHGWWSMALNTVEPAAFTFELQDAYFSTDSHLKEAFYVWSIKTSSNILPQSLAGKYQSSILGKLGWNQQRYFLLLETFFSDLCCRSHPIGHDRRLYCKVIKNLLIYQDHQGQGCIFRLTCSHPELIEDHVLTNAYIRILRTATRNAVNKSV